MRMGGVLPNCRAPGQAGARRVVIESWFGEPATRDRTGQTAAWQTLSGRMRLQYNALFWIRKMGITLSNYIPELMPMGKDSS